MTVYIRTLESMDSTIYYNVDCKRLKSLKSEYRRKGFRVKDKGTQGTFINYRLIELRKEN